MLSAEQEEQAACRKAPTALFFSDKAADVSAAKSFCFRCPILADCMRENLTEPAGTWGALTEGERKQVAKILKRRTA